MRDDDLGNEGRGLLRRLVGFVITVALVSEYIVLVAATLSLRALLGVASGVWTALSLRKVTPDPAAPSTEAA